MKNKSKEVSLETFEQRLEKAMYPREFITPTEREYARKPLSCSSPIVIKGEDGKWYRHHEGYARNDTYVPPSWWPMSNEESKQQEKLNKKDWAENTRNPFRNTGD